MTATKQRDRYHQLVKSIIYHMASLEIHRAHAHMHPGPVPEVITSTECTIETTIAALEGIDTFLLRQSITARARLVAFTANSAGHVEVLASNSPESRSQAP